MLPSVKRRLAVATTCYALLGLTGVLFLDGVPSRREAHLAVEEKFCASVGRARGYAQ